MNKLEYVKNLSERLKSMIEKNEESQKAYQALIKKFPILEQCCWNNESYRKVRENLTLKEEQVYVNMGVIYKKSDFRRVRIELNKVLLEFEKE